MVIPVTKWYCGLCKSEHDTESEAQICEDGHYKVGKVIGVYYVEGRCAPYKIQVEVDIGGDTFEKDIFYGVIADGWGNK